ncbi:hypothetical protein PGRAN_02360 [Listeria grandensis FSL F6-0971]|uniref:Uncharacterized protein n=1 Tax=Listeria grandensis FSL F6-0971 TaxID=1265819 RepID=W7BNT5_9LIST|nr:hypothetical protein [Listeria grandensis]EUJ24701.1 hypothetical protein PGRAN_02360 [Listeria grandensis FSL F6-0971]
MHEKLISTEITKLLAKEIFRFADFWFDNYYTKNLAREILRQHPDFIAVYRPRIVATVANSLKAVSGGSYSQLDYYNLGKTEAQNGLTAADAIRNRYSFEEATETFLKKRNEESSLGIAKQEIDYYMEELNDFHEIIMPLILQGYTHHYGYAKKR